MANDPTANQPNKPVQTTIAPTSADAKAKVAAALASPSKGNMDPTKGATVVTTKAPPFMISGAQTDKRWLNALFYGPYGAGKTTLAGSAADVPAMCDILFIDAESGSLALEDSPQIKNVGGIDTVRVNNFQMVAHVQEFLKAHCIARDRNDEVTLRALEARVKGCSPDEIITPRRYRTVVVDSLTEVNTFSLYQLLNIATDMKLVDAQVEVAQFAEYNRHNQMMQLVIRAYRDLPIHVILVCAVLYDQDELKRYHYTPYLTGKLSRQVQGFVDIVGFLQVGKQKEGEESAARRLYVQPVGNFDAKNRRASFKAPFIEDPSMTKIFEAWGLPLSK